MAAPAAQAQANDSKLQGVPPRYFDGDRSKSDLFLREFKVFRGLNATKEIMTTPYLRTMLALSHIKGPLVDDWVDDQVEELIT
jgi:hypothetical protein